MTTSQAAGRRPRRSPPASLLARLAAAIAALGAGGAAVVLAAVLIEQTPGPISTSLPGAAAGASPATYVLAGGGQAPPGFPTPPAGAVVFSREDRADALALGLVAHGSRLLAQVSLLGPEGNGATGLRVEIGVSGASRRASVCGPGCYRASLPLQSRGMTVSVDIRGGGATTRWRVRLPTRWPMSAATLMARAGAVWRALRSLSYVDRLASGPGEEVTSDWQVVAPDRLAYEVEHGSDAIIIGDKRWDRPPGGAWSESPQDPPLTQPLPFWVSVKDAHLLGAGRFAGLPVWIVSFFDPSTPAWFEVELDKSTLHTLDLRMITTAHFMHDTYSAFDGPPEVNPPRAT